MTGLESAFWAALIWLEVVIVLRIYFAVRYRVKVGRLTADEGYRDINHGRCPWWRWEAFQSVSYERMILFFWRPLNSFYPNTEFMQPSSRGVFIDSSEHNNHTCPLSKRHAEFKKELLK